MRLKLDLYLHFCYPNPNRRNQDRKREDDIKSSSIAVWQDLPDHWQLRGGVGMDFATHTHEGPDEVLNFNLAAGYTLTTHEDAPIGDLTPYLSANLNQDLGMATILQISVSRRESVFSLDGTPIS